MKICYIDESGTSGVLPSPTSNVDPLLVVAGFCVDHRCLHDITAKFMQIKGRFFPNLVRDASHHLDKIRVELKGSTIRSFVRRPRRRQRRHAIGFLTAVLDLLEYHNAKIMGRIYVKGIGSPMDGDAVYTYSIQSICDCFQDMLARQDDTGIVILDSRRKAQNDKVSHSVFTRKFKSSGDEYGRILESPTFGHSDNHAGIQIADLLCSGFLFPMAACAYCLGTVTNVHVYPEYRLLIQHFGVRLKAMQHRYQTSAPPKRWTGGIVVSDGLGRKSGSALFG